MSFSSKCDAWSLQHFQSPGGDSRTLSVLINLSTRPPAAICCYPPTSSSPSQPSFQNNAPLFTSFRPCLLNVTKYGSVYVPFSPGGCSAQFQLLNSITGSRAVMPVTRQLCAKYKNLQVGDAGGRRGGKVKATNQRSNDKAILEKKQC